MSQGAKSRKNKHSEGASKLVKLGKGCDRPIKKKTYICIYT